jgi:hypothetical protein
MKDAGEPAHEAIIRAFETLKAEHEALANWMKDFGIALEDGLRSQKAASLVPGGAPRRYAGCPKPAADIFKEGDENRESRPSSTDIDPGSGQKRRLQPRDGGERSLRIRRSA